MPAPGRSGAAGFLERRHARPGKDSDERSCAIAWFAPEPARLLDGPAGGIHPDCSDELLDATDHRLAT